MKKPESRLLTPAELNEIVAECAHELKTPLTTLRLQLQLLQREPAPATEHFRAMGQSLARIDRLVDDLAHASRDGHPFPLQLQRVEINRLVQEVATQFKPHFTQNGTSVEVIPDTEAHLWLDPERIEQVLANLLVNALKYAPASSVTLLIRCDRTQVRIHVKDHGPGISPEDSQRIFEKNARGAASGRSPGQGLGLYLARRIIEQHEGRLQLASAPGMGALFFIDLPRSP